MIKKTILLTLFICMGLKQSFASGIGFVDYNKIIQNYNYAKIAERELYTKSVELQKYLEEKEVEYSKLDSPIQKNKFEQEMKAEVQKREIAFDDFRAKREETIKTRLKTTIDKVRIEKGLDVILSIDNIYSGGIDITEDVIEILNK